MNLISYGVIQLVNGPSKIEKANLKFLKKINKYTLQ